MPRINLEAARAMALRWAKQFRPGMLEELRQTQGPDGPSRWAQERAQSLLAALAEAEDSLVGLGLPAGEIATRLQSLSEQIRADHFPATSGEDSGASFPGALRPMLESERDRILAKAQADGLTPEEGASLWESLEPSIRAEILEDADAARVDAGG
jgi:hypothetical protein